MRSKAPRPKTEITEQEFIELLKANPGHFNDGLRYMVAIKLRGLVWNKPIGYVKGGKFFKFND